MADDGGGGQGGSAEEGPAYLVASAVFGPDTTTSYLSVLPSLDAQEIDYAQSVELNGWADVWVHEGFVFVSDGDAPLVRKYEVNADREIVEVASLSFGNYATDGKFWSNTFVAPDKAYMIAGTSEYVIWNPETMEITGTLELPDLEEREGYLVRAGTLDRSNVIRDGKLFQPFYWSDEDWVFFTPDSRVAVIDIATDTVEDVLEVPCSGLDLGTREADGDLYFSTWTSGVFEPLLGEAEPNCVAKIPAGTLDVEVAFTFEEVSGHEGAAVRAVNDGRLVLSVFDEERAGFADADDPIATLGEKNWQLFSYEPESEEAAPIESIDWNSGAIYVYPIDDRDYLLIPGTGYASTELYVLDDRLEATKLIELRGWGLRLFRIR